MFVICEISGFLFKLAAMCEGKLKACGSSHIILLVIFLVMTPATIGRFHRDDQKNVCYSAPCQNGGECIDLTTAAGEKRFQCACMDGYQGLTCQKRINPCAAEPCKNEGQCVPRPGNSFHCICAKGFQGRHCENKKSGDPCENKPCSTNGVCIPTNDEFICECQSGYSGPRCRQKITSHDEQPATVAVPPPVPADSPYSGLVIGLLVTVITLVVILLLVGVHCVRVMNRLSNLKAARERRKIAGEDPGDCPGMMETSNRMCIDFWCCRDRKKYLGEVTGVIVPVDEFKTMMKNQQENDKVTTRSSLPELDKNDFPEDYDKEEKRMSGQINTSTRASRHTDLHSLHNEPQKKASRHSHSSYPLEEHHSNLKQWPDERETRQFHADKSPSHLERKGTEHMTSVIQSPEFNQVTAQGPSSAYATPQQIGYQTPRYSTPDMAMNANTFDNMVRPQQSYYTKSTGDLYGRPKGEAGNLRPSIKTSPPFKDSPKPVSSAPILLETPPRPYNHPQPQADNTSKHSIIMSPPPVPLEAANLSKHQVISQTELQKRMSKLLQRQSELSQAAVQLSRYSQVPSVYYGHSDFTFPTDNIKHSMVPTDNKVYPAAPGMNKNTRHRLKSEVNRSSSGNSEMSNNLMPGSPAAGRKRSIKPRPPEPMAVLGLPPAHSGRSIMASKHRKSNPYRDANLNYTPSDDNTSADEIYFNNNSECDDISVDNLSPFEYFEEPAAQKRDKPGRRNKVINSISQNVRKQRKRFQQNLNEDYLDETDEQFEPRIDKRQMQQNSAHRVQRENNTRSLPKVENRSSRDIYPRSDTRRKGNSSKNETTRRRQKGNYMLLPQRSDSDVEFDDLGDIDPYQVEGVQAQHRHDTEQYNQIEVVDEDEDNDNDEDSGDESVERPRRPAMDDGYVSTGRMSESDVGGRDRDPLSVEQRLVNQRNQVYHIRPRLNGEDMVVRGNNRHRPTLSANTTDDENQNVRRVIRQPVQSLVPKRIVNNSYSNEQRRRAPTPQQVMSVVRQDNERNTSALKKSNGNLEIPGGEKKKMKRGEIPSAYKKSVSRIRLKRKEGQSTAVNEPMAPRLKGILKKKQNNPNNTNTNKPYKR